jgi:uncharacterized protein
MSPARSDQVNAVELAGRAATLEREFDLTQLPRLVEAGALAGTRVHAVMVFSKFEGRPMVSVRVDGRVMLPCQRCLAPSECRVDDAAQLVIVADDSADVPGGFETAIGDVEHLSVAELIEEQVLLGMPLVPLHEDESQCGPSAAPQAVVEPGSAAEEKQRPFSNLRELLDQGER